MNADCEAQLSIAEVPLSLRISGFVISKTYYNRGDLKVLYLIANNEYWVILHL
jgi:hypothetical protein